MSERTRFGKYELVQRLAHGGMGETFRAELVAAAGVTKQVVIKKMLPQIATDPALVQSFIDEARVSATLTHANIAQVFDFGEVDGEYFIAMEWVDGRALSTAVKRAKLLGWDRLPFQLSVHVVVKLLEGLQYAHTRNGPDGAPLNLVHRDITPDNLLLGFEGDVKLVDFGVAKTSMVGRQQTEPGLIKGKYRYVSPEQAVAKPVDARSDLFTVGVVLYQLLTGEMPFAGDEYTVMQAIVEGSYVPPRVRAGDVPEPLDGIVRKALASNPGDRFGSAREMLEPLSRWLYGVSPDFSGELLRELMGHLFDADLLGEGRLFISHENARTKLMAMEPKRHVEAPTQQHHAVGQERETKPSNPVVARQQAPTQPEHSAIERRRTPVALVLLAGALGVAALGLVGSEVREAMNGDAEPVQAPLSRPALATTPVKPEAAAPAPEPSPQPAPAAAPDEPMVRYDAEGAPVTIELAEEHQVVVPLSDCRTVGRSWRVEPKPFDSRVANAMKMQHVTAGNNPEVQRTLDAVAQREQRQARDRSRYSDKGRMLDPLALLTPALKPPRLFLLGGKVVGTEAGRFCPFMLSARASEKAQPSNLRIDGKDVVVNAVVRVEPDDRFVVRSFPRGKDWTVKVSDVKPPWPVMLVTARDNDEETPIILDRAELKIENPVSAWLTVPVQERGPYARTVTIALAPGERLDDTDETLAAEGAALMKAKKYSEAVRILTRCVELFRSSGACRQLLVEAYQANNASKSRAYQPR